MKKAPIMVAFVLVAGLFAAAFSLAPAIAQYIPPSDSTSTSSASNTTLTSNTTSSSNTTDTTANATGGETFSAKGSIATLLFDTGEVITTSEVQNETTSAASNDSSMTAGNAETSSNTTTSLSGNTTMTLPQITTGVNSTSSINMTGFGNTTGTGNTTSTTSNETSRAEEEKPYLLSGDWNLGVRDGNVTDFAANFTMVHIDGTSRHTHDLSNFVSSNSTTIDTSANGTSYIFGTVDVTVNGEPKWTGVDALIIIEKNNVVSISLATEDTDDHFMGQPIYGIIDSMKDQNGNEMVETGGTQTADIATNQTTIGNQTAGGFLGNVTEGIKDFFNGTKK